MALRTLVKASEINNLSDARYCAGMGVEMIGFCLNENDPNFIGVNKLREIINWLSGIKIVGEFKGDNRAFIHQLSNELPLDYIQISDPIAFEELSEIGKPIILKINFNWTEIERVNNLIKSYKEKASYFLLETSTQLTKEHEVTLKDWIKTNKIILGFGIDKDSLNYIVNELSPAGISIKGENEIKPGLKDFETLSEVLELLEDDN